MSALDLTDEQRLTLRSIVLARGDLLARRWLESLGFDPAAAREMARQASDAHLGQVRPLQDVACVALLLFVSFFLPDPFALIPFVFGEREFLRFWGLPLWTVLALPPSAFFVGRALFVMVERRVYLAEHPLPPGSADFAASLTHRGSIERLRR